MTMIERVAGAIHSEPYLPVCDFIRERNRMANITLDPFSEGLQIAAEWAIRQAKAAITAMREPTEAMVVSGNDAVDGDDIESSTPLCVSTWHAMIDAALKE